MSYFAICSFDLKSANSQDYQDAYSDLKKMGLSHTLTTNQGGTIQLPTTMAAGEFTATSAIALRDNLCDKVQSAFKARKFTSEIFILVGGDWGWGHRTT